MRVCSCLAVLQLLSLVLAGPDGLRASSAQGKLESVHSLKCAFSVSATGNWTNGEPQGAIKAADLSVQFTEINPDEGTAKGGVLETPTGPRNGGFDPLHIIAQQALGSLHLIQMGSAGPIYLTTVFESPSRGGKLKAVHTRHEYTASLTGYTSRPEQYYGECEILK